MASNVNKPNKNDSFKIDGTIHSKPVSDYVENRVEYGKRKPRLLIAILSVITLLSFGWGAIVQY
ncbi:MAG: hypothetical protein KJP21_08215, partial [Bacteroidia bacterium]|nr:hypothetical protein [Bacteroidia bacterium]